MKGRGFTLLELMVAGGLLSLLLTVSLNVLLPSLQASSRASARVDMQQRLTLSMESLLADLERCSASSVAVFPAQGPNGPSGLSMQRMDGFTSGGFQTWEPALISYHWRPDDGRLVRGKWSGGPPTLSVAPVSAQPVLPSPADFLLLVNNLGGGEKLLAESVKQFGLSWNSRTLHIDLLAERSVSGCIKKECFEMHRSFCFRNSW
jgi:type II secretory pathway pseudopilin PulG